MNDTPTNQGLNVAPKTSAAVGAGGVSVAIVEIMQWGLSFAHIQMTASVAVAFSTLLIGAASWYAPRSHAPPPKVDNQTT